MVPPTPSLGGCAPRPPAPPPMTALACNALRDKNTTVAMWYGPRDIRQMSGICLPHLQRSDVKNIVTATVLQTLQEIQFAN